ncbi:MAG TPA: acetyltransferase [Tenuifilaceae bacterium]|nr:acetyltransferase [Tenuifilaceae bacterium]
MYLYGASGHAKVIIEIAELLGITIHGIFDDNPSIKELFDYKVIGSAKKEEVPSEPVLISIGNNKIRKIISQKFNFNYCTLIHPKSFISKRCIIDEGTVVMGHSIINSDTVIGKHAIINTSASIDHECIIGNFTHISPNVTLSGGIRIGEGTHIGSGAVVAPNIRIGKWVTVGAGAVIIKDIPDYAVVVGNPGRIVKYNEP